MDASRKLTEAGRAQIRTMGQFLTHQIGRVDLVVTSNFVRALDTARGMAEDLGCELVETTPALDPDGKPETAWSDVIVLTHALCPEPDTAHVLVVSHHPLIGELAAYLCQDIGWCIADADVKTSDEKFHHAAIMHLDGDGPGAVMEYFVPPKVVERLPVCADSPSGLSGQSVRDDMADVVEAAARVIEIGIDWDASESLKHPKHADVLQPLRDRAARALGRFFSRQKRLLMREIKPKLRDLRESSNAGMREDDDPEDKTRSVIPDRLPLAVTGGTSYDYSSVLNAAINAGYESFTDDIEDAPELAEDIVQRYLTDHSLTKLTGNFEATTVERLRNALADAYAEGADYEGLVKAVQDEYAGFSSVRAGMIAQTEMNNAYNSGRMQLGLDMGFNEKAWNPDGTACPEICLPNVAQGWIPIDEDFLSGDDAPSGHPNCDCSLDIRYNPKTAEGEDITAA